MKTLLLLCVLVSWRLQADGKVFPPTAVPSEVRIPDQRALLSWSNGMERLIIETRFIGAGTNFAWVVPLPSRPVVEPASRGLFPTLLHLMQPRVIHAPSNAWLPGLALTAALVAVILSRWTAAKAVAFMGILVLLAGMLLPALSTAGAKAGGRGASVEILDRQCAGVFESTTVTGRDPAALRAWFQVHGYSLPADVEPVIADYLRDGWVFVASRVFREVSTHGPDSLHPLSFTFQAKEPVYPLRLTGVGNGELDVDLFVFGPERAAAPGFRVRDARPAGGSPPDSLRWLPEEHLRVWHEALGRAAAGASWVTRLHGKLTPARMRKDAVIRWDGTTPRHEALYSARGAWGTVANWMVNGFNLVLVGLLFRARVRNQPLRTLGVPVAATALVMLLGTLTAVAILPIVPVRLESKRALSSDVRHQRWAVEMALEDGLDTNAPVTLEDARKAIQRELPAWLETLQGRKTAMVIREEDSPYMYSLRATPQGVDLLLHNGWGGVSEAISFPRRPGR